MNTEQNERLKQLLTDAHELAPNERAAFLSQACADDDELRREVESLLAFDETGASWLEHTAWKQVAGEIVSEETTTLLDKTIGHYRIQSLLGAGGMGQVYLALDTKLGRQVAIKFLPQHFTSEAERVRRFEQEARAASALNHPNIITIHEIGQYDGWHYIVMEHVAGQTLRTRLQAGKLPHEEAIDIATQVADALAAAHHAGIVHRDIKPENIMVTAGGLVKVLDFGIAKLGEAEIEGRSERETERQETETTEFLNAPTRSISPSLTRFVSTALGTVMGTVNYMSPEQARGEALNGQADVFSLGQMLLEMVMGKSLFAGQAAQDVLQLLRGEQEPLVDDYKFDGVPRALEQVIRKALKRNLSERYETAQQMLNDLKTLQRSTATKKLRRIVAASVVVEVLALIVAMAAIWREAPPPIIELWKEKVLRTGHTATVRRAVFSPDGKRLVSVSEDQQVIVWDFARREKIKTLTGHSGWVNSVAFSPDGKWFATGSSDHTVIVWNAEKLEKAMVLEAHRDAVMAVAFAPNGKRLATASGSDTGASVDFRTVIWEVEGWKKLRDLPEGRSYGNLLFSPDSRLLKTQNAQWDVGTGHKVTKEGDGLGWNWSEFAPGAKQMIAAGAGGIVSMALVRPGQLVSRGAIHEYREHQDFGRTVAFSPDGKQVATGADDVVIWETATMKVQSRFEFASAVWSLTFSPDGHWLVSTHSNGTILVWNVARQRREFSFDTHTGAVRAIAVSPDGKRYASAGDDRTIIVWNAETDGQEAVLRKHNTRVINLVFSPDSQWLASLDQDGELIRWDIEGRKPDWETKVIMGADCLAVAPNGKYLITHQVVTDCNDGHELFRLGKPHNKLEPLGLAAFSADGKLLAGVQANFVLLIDTQSWQVIDRQDDGAAPLVSLSFSSDGTKLLTGSADGRLMLWEAKPLRKIGLLGKHAGRIAAVTFSPTGETAASAGSDQMVKLWNVSRQQWMQDVGTHAAPVAAVAFTPDGKRLLTGEQDRTMRVYTQQRELWKRN